MAPFFYVYHSGLKIEKSRDEFPICVQVVAWCWWLPQRLKLVFFKNFLHPLFRPQGRSVQKIFNLWYRECQLPKIAHFSDFSPLCASITSSDLLMSHYPMSQLMCRPSRPALSLFSKNWWLNCTFGNANGHPGEGEYYSTSAAATAKGLTRAQLPSKRQSSLTLGNKNSSIWTTTFVLKSVWEKMIRLFISLDTISVNYLIMP